MSVERYGRYEIRREIGRGGMGVVYLAYDPVVRRDVALKVLPAGLPGDDRVIARLRQEARLTAALEHASIVPVYDVGEQGDRPFLVMRYMSGGTVQRWLTNGRLDLRRAGEILTRVAAALDAAHRQGIIHRDLKPSNILFDAQGQAYLSDFGIAKALDAGSNLSLTGTAIVGTPAYMSPEQAIGDKAIDGRSDTYSLG
ncbi:MAG TPA: serine/threonine-protein kinase, partial [Anaerolineales bacterium]|nr:serine/threonine-protein kinase [Anaerolineales bacterium]